ncbi:MAG: ATP-binding protein [Planctomycetota bacterium]
MTCWALPESRRKSMLSKLKVATIGLNGQRYNLGQSIDVNQLFGLKVPGPAYEGRARLSIIYLAHLSQDHQQEFLATLFASMYQWMLTQGDDLSGLLYMDEIAPFCPPVAKPPAKAGLMLLLRQARKYGLCTVLATQSPGDLDYKALGQIGTVALGRMSQRQDVGKVDGFLRSMANIDAGAISEGLANHKQGEFIVINPNHLSGPQAIKARWLATEHRLVGRDSIGELVSLDDRERFG